MIKIELTQEELVIVLNSIDTEISNLGLSEKNNRLLFDMKLELFDKLNSILEQNKHKKWRTKISPINNSTKHTKFIYYDHYQDAVKDFSNLVENNKDCICVIEKA